MKEVHDSGSAIIRDVILGGQDGLVNVLGIVLAVAEATETKYIVLVAGLAATFAESISMAAVAYTSAKAGKEFYKKKREEVEKNVRDNPNLARAALKAMYQKCGLSATLMNKAIQSLLKDKRKLHDTWVNMELQQSEEFEHPVRDAFVVGFAAIIGSLIPLAPFMVLPVQTAVFTTLGLSTLALFASGAMKARFTGVSPFKSAVEMAIVGMTAAISGYLIGKALGVLPIA